MMDDHEEEILDQVVKTFSLDIDDKMLPDGANKKHYPNAIRKIAR